MTKLKQALVDGEIFVTSKTLVREAVIEAIKHLGHSTGFYQEGEPLTQQEMQDVADEVIDYLTD